MSQTNNTDPNTPKKKMTSKQIVAIIGIVLLVLMYLVTLIVAIVDSSASGRLFAMCLFASFALPFLIWIYSWLYQKYKDRDKEEGSTYLFLQICALRRAHREHAVPLLPALLF